MSKLMNTNKRSAVLAIFVLIMALSLVTAGSITASALAVKKIQVTRKVQAVKKQKNEKRLGFPKHYDTLEEFL